MSARPLVAVAMSGGVDSSVAAALLSRAGEVSVFVFARPGQEHSARTLHEMAGCSAGFTGKPVRWVVVVSGSFAPAEVKAALAEAGLNVQKMLDGLYVSAEKGKEVAIS